MESSEKKFGVFISYSHEDAMFVAPIVKLISAMREDLVFQDTKEIKPGKKWEHQLISALDQAQIIIIFWCKHSAKSKYVQSEYKKAIIGGKDILPVLLDDCKLNEDLTGYQWIDFQNVISHPKDKIKPIGHFNYPKTLKIIVPVFIILIVIIAGFFLFNSRTGKSPFSEGSANGPATYQGRANDTLARDSTRAMPDIIAIKKPVPDTISAARSRSDTTGITKSVIKRKHKPGSKDSALSNYIPDTGNEKIIVPSSNPGSDEYDTRESPSEKKVLILKIALLTILVFAVLLRWRINRKRNHKSLNSDIIASGITDKLNEKLPPR